LKASQKHALSAILNREFPLAAKRLSEAENHCSNTAVSVLTQITMLDELSSVLTSIGQTEAVSQDKELVERLSMVSAKFKNISQTLNTIASFDDLVGQRILKVSDFLDTAQPIFQEILNDLDAPFERKKTSFNRSESKSFGEGDQRGSRSRRDADRPHDPSFSDERDRKTSPKKSRVVQIRETNSLDQEHNPKEAESSEPTATPSEQQEEAPKQEELFGPDDDGLSQNEVNNLMKKLYPQD
jgi:hypothetical protein